MNNLFPKWALLIAVLFFMATLPAQSGGREAVRNGKPEEARSREISAREYLATYSPVAVRHMELYGIPASIKMAQAMHESGNGNSDLARRSNNHFGIKCKSEWTGPAVYHDDDEAGECFRKYANIIDSFTDHSEYLHSRSWYAPLFELDIMDYRAWAYGLKEAGYATDPLYAEKLIALIERYELYLLDEEASPSYVAQIVPLERPDAGGQATGAEYAAGLPDYEDFTVSVFKIGCRDIFLHDGVRYIVAREGDSYESLARDTGIRLRRLLRFNGKSRGASLAAGEAVYLERAPKR